MDDVDDLANARSFSVSDIPYTVFSPERTKNK